MNTSAILYFGSRALAALGNLLAVATFTRIAGPEEYGKYVLIFAWSMIVYGFTAQWMRFAYFGTYKSGRINEYVASLARLHVAALGILAISFGAMALLGSFDRPFLISIFAVVFGMTIYESAFEVTRTLPNAIAAAMSMIIRACLIIGLGSALLWSEGTSTGLAFGIAIAHLLAAIPCLTALSGVRLSESSQEATATMLRYGWPLLLSFGVVAVGQSIDRLLLAHFAGTLTLGPYGVIADLLRQSFSVVGEGIILALGTAAKQYANEGDIEASNRELRKCYNSCLATAVFGAVFFVVFGDFLVNFLLGGKFVGPSHHLIPIFAIAFAFMTMRNFYFGQVIYFIRTSHLELIMSVLFVAASSLLSILLIPRYGAQGAAFSLMMAFVITCLAYVIAGRRQYYLPVDLAGTGTIALAATLFLAGVWLVDRLTGQPAVALFTKGTLFAIIAAIVARRLGILRTSSAGGTSRTVPATAATQKSIST